MTSRTVRIATLAVALGAAACGKESCNVENLVFNYSQTMTGIGPTAGQPVVKVDVTQNYLSHTPYAACTTGPLQDVGVVDVTVTSLSSTPLKVVYEVQGLNELNVPAWAAASDTLFRIGPGEKITRNKVTVTPVKLEYGARITLTEVTPVP